MNLSSAALIPVPPFRLTATTTTAAPVATTAPPAAQLSAVARNFTVEQTAWWATRDPRFDHGPLIAQSGITGTLPSPIAITPPVQPWNPIHLDWEIEYIPSTNAVADWTLGEIDYTTDPTIAPPAPDPTQTQTGLQWPAPRRAASRQLHPLRPRSPHRRSRRHGRRQPPPGPQPGPVCRRIRLPRPQHHSRVSLQSRPARPRRLRQPG